MTLEKQISTSIKLIDGFYQNANDQTLDFMKMTPQNRDKICACEYQIIPETSSSYMSVRYTNNNVISIYYHPDVQNLEQNYITKIIGHEIEHVQQLMNTKNDLVENVYSSPLYWKALEIAQSPYAPYVGIGFAVLDSLVPHVGFVIPYIGSYTGIIATTYVSRLMEHRADDVADRLVPEISLKDKPNTKAEIYKNFGSIEKYNSSIMDMAGKTPIGPLLHVIYAHPSDYSRFNQSDKNCPIYLEEKKRLNIPSIYIPT